MANPTSLLNSLKTVFRGRRAVKRNVNKYRPHQSRRECTRRAGGDAWEMFKRYDRVRRGLHPDKHHQENGNAAR